MINEIYQTVQSLMNKDQLGYFKPIDFNLFASNAQREEYNDYFNTLKSNIRRKNWMLDGKDFADISEHNQQLLEYFSKETTLNNISDTSESIVVVPSDVEFVRDLIVLSTGKKIEKVSYSDYKDLQRNIYANPTNCSPIGVLVGTNIKILPNNIESVLLHYLRKPKNPKWTYQEVNGKAYFDPTASDFQDFDLPETSKNRLIISIAEQAGVSIRDTLMIQTANQNKSQEFQTNNQE